MFDNQIIAALISVIRSGLVAQQLSEVKVKQSYQPTAQGAEIGPTIYLHKLFVKRHGSPEVTDLWNEPGATMVHSEKQLMETTFQANALAAQNPADTQSKTAADLLNATAHALQSETGLAALREAGMSILRITSLTNPPIIDDRDRNEYSPSFDFVIGHEQAVVTETPVIESTEININSV